MPGTILNPASDEGLGDEGVLLARLKAGDPAAYESLVRMLAPRMLAVAKRFLPNEDDAQEALQDAFVSAFKALPKFEGNSRLATWLHRIVVNACLMKLRTRRRRPETLIDDLMPRFQDDGHHESPIAAWTSDSATGPADPERVETRALVRARIDELPDGYREVLLLRDIEGLDTDSTAAALSMTPNAVKTRLHRARMALRTLLDPDFREGRP